MESGSRGVWCTTSDANVVLTCAGVGFDWLVLDAQHGDLDRRSVIELGRTLAAVGLAFGVRVPGLDASWIGAALDAGAAMVIVPQVDTAKEAAVAVDACFYPPIGNRSWGPFPALWGGDVPRPEVANVSVRCAVMIESARALDNLDEIAKVPGVGLLFVGPFDLSLSLGLDVDEAIADENGPLRRVLEAGRQHHLDVAAFAGDAERARAMRTAGIDTLAVATDLGLIRAGAAAALAG